MPRIVTPGDAVSSKLNPSASRGRLAYLGNVVIDGILAGDEKRMEFVIGLRGGAQALAQYPPKKWGLNTCMTFYKL
ncbi:MAG: hypothetical protein LBF22_05745 [Deltaproteobacteria bacterium]|nr:hypothetical protein [Deltaproteobacteria bacterium]